MVSIRTLCVAAVLLAVAAQAQYGCSNYYSCSSCIGDYLCGWDSSSGSCKTGTASGPTYGYTSSSNWYYTSCPSTVWSVTGWALWVCVCGGIFFWVFICSVCCYRRRRAVIVTNLAQPMVVGVAPGVAYGQTMNTSYPAQQGSPYGQPNPYAQQQPNPYAQQQGSPYGQPQQQGYAQPAAYPAPQQQCAPGATPV